jgi:hypothetical protein
MRQLNPADRAQLAGEVRAFAFVSGPRSQLAASLGYVESSELPRADGVVRLELQEFCTSMTRLAWAEASGCRWDWWACALAAQGGHLEALRWAREHGCPWNRWTCRYAAKGVRLEVLQWARAHGCPWEQSRMCYCTAEGGHLAVLQWARAHGCPWIEAYVRARAAAGGYMDMLRWLDEQGE